MKKPIKIGVVGAGGIAKSVHFPSLAEIGGITLEAVCDLRRERAEEAALQFPSSRVYTSYLEMFEREHLDGVFLLVQPDQTFRIASDALKRGLHVFTEKPAGLTLFQTESLARLARQYQRILQVGMNRRYLPLFQTVLKKMRAEGPITQVEACFVKHGDASFFEGCGSAYICDTIHAIDILRFTADAEPANAATVVSRGNSAVDTGWNSVIRFENGVTGVLKANYQTGGRVHSFELHGPSASAYIDIGFGGESCTARILRCAGAGTYSLSSAGSGGVNIEVLDGIQIAGSDQYYRYYGYYDEDQSFIDCIRDGTTPLSDIDSAVKSMRLAEYLLSKAI